MQFKFTVRGLFLLTTLVAILVAIGLWLAQSPMFIVVFVYLLMYIGAFLLLYVFRYRQQLRQARAAWKEHQLARTGLNEAMASKQDYLKELPVEHSPEDTT